MSSVLINAFILRSSEPTAYSKQLQLSILSYFPKPFVAGPYQNGPTFPDFVCMYTTQPSYTSVATGGAEQQCAPDFPAWRSLPVRGRGEVVLFF